MKTTGCLLLSACETFDRMGACVSGVTVSLINCSEKRLNKLIGGKKQINKMQKKNEESAQYRSSVLIRELNDFIVTN